MNSDRRWWWLRWHQHLLDLYIYIYIYIVNIYVYISIRNKKKSKKRKKILSKTWNTSKSRKKRKVYFILYRIRYIRKKKLKVLFDFVCLNVWVDVCRKTKVMKERRKKKDFICHLNIYMCVYIDIECKKIKICEVSKCWKRRRRRKKKEISNKISRSKTMPDTFHNSRHIYLFNQKSYVRIISNRMTWR